MRAFAELFTILFIGLFLGGGLSWFSIQENHGFGAINVGEWTAWPNVGSLDADPYSKAKVAAEGDVPLGAAEGLAFFASNDNLGEPLDRSCEYFIEGQTPPARFWTLSAHEKDGKVLRLTTGEPSHILSRHLIRGPSGEFSISAQSAASAQNWLRIEGTGNFELILRLYDSPVASTSGIVDLQMPQIRKKRCSS